MTTVTMIDTTGANAAHIPVSAPKVAGYVTGSGAVPWTAAHWARFPDSGHVRIDQSPAGAVYAAGGADVYDIEDLAGTPAHFPGLVKVRLAAGKEFSDFYASRATVPAVVQALDAAGALNWWHGHVRLWLADWDLSLAGAINLIGTRLAGLLIVAVQWASPRSNPGTILPGTTTTLRDANCDLSITAGYWHAAPVLPAPPPPVKTLDGYVVYAGAAGGFAGRAVTSADGGSSWR